MQRLLMMVVRRLLMRGAMRGMGRMSGVDPKTPEGREQRKNARRAMRAARMANRMGRF